MEEQILPLRVQKAFIEHASGANWKEAAEIGGIGTEYLSQWRKLPDADDYIQTAIEKILVNQIASLVIQTQSLQSD